jgi:hypothetical protein
LRCGFNAVVEKKIAKANNISTGAVSNIVKEWENKIGKDLALGLRMLYGSLHGESLSVAECAIGFRIMKMFNDQGLDSETSFSTYLGSVRVSELYLK